MEKGCVCRRMESCNCPIACFLVRRWEGTLEWLLCEGHGHCLHSFVGRIISMLRAGCMATDGTRYNALTVSRLRNSKDSIEIYQQLVGKASLLSCPEKH